MDVVTPTRRGLSGERTLRSWLWASLVANMVIIVTGAVVRLTDSGLGCPTWPRCGEESLVPHAALGLHGMIEFGNRLLTFVLIAIAIGAFASAWVNRGRSTRLWWLTLVVLVGIPFQGVIGGITVLTHLNPWVVALHLLLSVALIVICVWALVVARGDEPDAVPSAVRALVILTFCLAMLATWIGTVVTGAGPNAGDLDAPRNGLEILPVARLHGMSAWLLVGATIMTLWLLHRAGARRAAGIAAVLLATELLQGAIGYTQYFTGLPTWLVACHLVGLTLLVAAASWLLFSVRLRRA